MNYEHRFNPSEPGTIQPTSNITLDLGSRDHGGVGVLAGNSLATKSQVIVIAHFKDIRHHVVRLNDEVFDNSINHRIRILNSRERNVANALKQFGNDDLSDVLDKVFLECRLAVFVVSKVIEQLLNGLAEALIVLVCRKLFAQELEFISNTIGVITVAVAKQEIAVIVQAIVLLSRLMAHDITLFFETGADVVVDGTEPILELRVIISITVDIVDRIEQVLSASVVRETLKNNLYPVSYRVM